MVLTIQERNRIVHLRLQGHGYGTIKTRLENDGTYVTRSGIKKLCRKFDQLGTVNNRKIQRAAKFGNEQAHKDYVDRVMEEHPDTTARALSDGIASTFNINVSKQTAARVRRKLKWHRKSTRYCQMIREVNKDKRLVWCMEQIERGETFDVSRRATL